MPRSSTSLCRRSRDDLNAGLADQQWVVEAYALATVSLLLVGGALGDQFGRRRIFTIGLIGFGITSILCAHRSVAAAS